MDNNKDAVYIQQLRKYCKDNKKWNEIFPVTFIQAIYNAANGNRLDTLLAMYNSIFVEYKGSFATTVAAIDNIVRKKGLIITYFDENNLSWTRRYKLHDVSDINFQNEDNWEGYNFDILIDEIYKAIEYIFNNIDKFPDLKNVLIQQITEVTENIFNNIEDYANLYNIFKELIKENINNVFNNINDYTNLKNLINTNIYNRVDYIFNNIDDFKVLLNKINVAILNRVDYIFNNINKYPELKQLIINSLQAKQLFTIEFSVNGDTLDIINKDELNSYIENNNVNNNALVTFIGKFFDSSNNKLLYNLVFTAFVNTNSNYLNLDNCYGETLIINNGKLYKCKINFNINTETEMSNPNWITYARKYDDIPTFEFNYISTNIYSIADIDDYNKYVNSFKYNTLVRFIFNESSTVINEYIGYINKVGSTLRILIYLQESNDFVYDTIISGIIENNELRISRLSNSDILTYLYNANSSGGVVLLDDETLIPSRFLPSYVDDVIDLLGGIVESTPTSGMTAGYKYYVTSTKKIFTASSATSGITSDPISDVIYVVPDDINGAIMYRWSGTTLVEIVNGGIVIGTTTGTAFDGARGLNNENILKSVPNKLITDVSVIAQGPNDDVIIRTTYSERTNNDGSYTANKYKDYQLPEANQGRAGLMSGDDKTKLDSIYNEYIINDENFFSVSQGYAFTLTTWGKSNFNAFRDAILDGKKVQLYLSSYEDGAEANINVPCEVAVSAKTLIITYVIPDLLKQVKATLTINDNNDNVSCSITNVINLTEVGSGLTIGTTSGTAFEGNRGLQAEKDIDKLQSYTNNGVVVNVESSNNSNGELKVTRCINSGGAIVTSEQYIALPQSSSSKAGLMSANDKTKLDNIIIIKLTGTDLTSVNEDTDINSVKNTNIDIIEFSTILDSLNSDKNVKIYINEYNDAVKQTFNINCDIAFNYNSKEIFIQYDIYDVNKRIYASLYKDGDRVSLEILAVKNKYTKFYYIDSNILYNPTKGKSINLAAAQFSMQQFDELVSDIQKRKDFCVYSTVFTSKNSDVKYYRYNINCIVNSNTQLLCNYINPLDNTYIKFTMNKLTTDVQIVINEKYNIINTVDVLNTIMSGLVLEPISGNQFETNQRYSSSDTLIQLINKFIQNSGYNDFRIVHSPTTINFVFGTTINNSNPIVNVLSFMSNVLARAPVLRIYSKSIDFSEVATLTYTELDNTIRDGSWRSFGLDLSNIGSGYTLPMASATTLGGIKIPANGQMTIDKDGNLYSNAATSNSAGIIKPGVGSGLTMNGSSISVTLGRRDINLGTLTPGSTINGGHYYIYDDTVLGNASPGFNLNNKINSWGDPLAIIIVNRKNTGGMYFKGTNINMLTATNDCTKIGAIFIRYFQNGNENGYFVWAVPKVIQ
nr:MAG: hypothetical protein [Bacteriophage sp.]